jgi:hypothetical protein
VPKRDDRWIALAKDQLGVSEDVFRDYLAHGDSVLLANWIHIIGPLLRLCPDNGRHWVYFLFPILRCISKFDIQNTLPGLQHDFCALWNEFVLEARKAGDPYFPRYILRPIRHFYVALHQGTDCAATAFDASTNDDDPILDEPSSYPLCTIPGHQFHINNATATAESTHTPNIPSTAVLPPHTVLNTTAPPDLSSFPALTPDPNSILIFADLSLNAALDTTPIGRSFPVSRRSENHGTATTPLDLTQVPTYTATISPSGNSD